MITKSINILTRSGLNIMATVQCTDSGRTRCQNLTERNCCRIWAFPEAKWNSASGCPDYHPEPVQPDVLSRNDNTSLDSTI